MIEGDHHKPLYEQLDKFFEKHASDEKSRLDAGVFRSLYKQFLEENPHIDWNSWKFITEDVQRKYEDLKEFDATRQDILKRLVVVKLNGGLGTTMGCEGPKSFIEVKDGMSFLDIALKQQEIFNSTHNSSVPLYLMNSFYTDEVTKQILPQWVKTFDQARCPRINADTLLPVDESGADEEWYPPGHGNIFQSLQFTGVLDELLEQGRDVMFVSNIDNTGACLDLAIAQYFVDQSADYVMECTEKTESDIKGGTLIDIGGQLMHLEIPQVPPENLDEFCSTRTFKIFNTNNIWVNLRSVKERLDKLKSEIIVNKKNLNGVPIIQLETSIGGCIRNFPKAYCVHVGRHRFLPVKKTDDLLAISSDLYSTTDKGTLQLKLHQSPLVDLGKCFQKVADFHARFGSSYPEMSDLSSLKVEGDVRFEDGVVLKGDVVIINRSPTQAILTSGTIMNNETKIFE